MGNSQKTTKTQELFKNLKKKLPKGLTKGVASVVEWLKVVKSGK